MDDVQPKRPETILERLRSAMLSVRKPFANPHLVVESQNSITCIAEKKSTSLNMCSGTSTDSKTKKNKQHSLQKQELETNVNSDIATFQNTAQAKRKTWTKPKIVPSYKVSSIESMDRRRVQLPERGSIVSTMTRVSEHDYCKTDEQEEGYVGYRENSVSTKRKHFSKQKREMSYKMQPSEIGRNSRTKVEKAQSVSRNQVQLMPSCRTRTSMTPSSRNSPIVVERNKSRTTTRETANRSDKLKGAHPTLTTNKQLKQNKVEVWSYVSKPITKFQPIELGDLTDVCSQGTKNVLPKLTCALKCTHGSNTMCNSKVSTSVEGFKCQQPGSKNILLKQMDKLHIAIDLNKYTTTSNQHITPDSLISSSIQLAPKLSRPDTRSGQVRNCANISNVPSKQGIPIRPKTAQAETKITSMWDDLIVQTNETTNSMAKQVDEWVLSSKWQASCSNGNTGSHKSDDSLTTETVKKTLEVNDGMSESSLPSKQMSKISPNKQVVDNTQQVQKFAGHNNTVKNSSSRRHNDNILKNFSKNANVNEHQTNMDNEYVTSESPHKSIDSKTILKQRRTLPNQIVEQRTKYEPKTKALPTSHLHSNSKTDGQKKRPTTSLNRSQTFLIGPSPKKSTNGSSTKTSTRPTTALRRENTYLIQPGKTSNNKDGIGSKKLNVSKIPVRKRSYIIKRAQNDLLDEECFVDGTVPLIKKSTYLVLNANDGNTAQECTPRISNVDIPLIRKDTYVILTANDQVENGGRDDSWASSRPYHK